MALSGVAAAVLIGGRSVRMGAPKALARITAGGESLIERAVATLDSVAADLTLVGAPDWPLPPSLAGRRVVVDVAKSAADGVVAALESSRYPFVIVVACDMPFLDADLLREMADRAVSAGRGCIAIDAGGSHPLHAVWDRERLTDLHDALARGERSLTALARLADLVEIDLDAPDRTERERWSTVNINTPEDLAAAQARARRGW